MVLSNIINKYTCNFRALQNIINRIKSNKQVPILDFANEDYNNFKHNYKVIHDSFVNYPDNTFALKFSSLGLSKDNENNAFNLSKKIINIAEKSKSVVLIDAEQNEIQKTDYTKLSTINQIQQIFREANILVFWLKYRFISHSETYIYNTFIFVL